jgi:hypothetical protein
MNWVEKNIEWLKSFVSETYENGVAGKASSQRLIELFVVGAFLIAFLKVTLALAILPGVSALALLDIPWGWATVIIGILGIKVYQKQAADKEAYKAVIQNNTIANPAPQPAPIPPSPPPALG